MLMQDTEFPFEILVRDDCSTDKTAEIIADYVRRFPKIIRPIFEPKNTFSKGVGPFPEILKHVSGKYIALLDGDDYWRDNNKLARQVDFLEKNDDFVVTHHNSIVIDHANNLSKDILYENLSDYDGEQLICVEAHLNTGTVVFRASAYRQMDLFKSAFNGDTILWHQLGFHGNAKFLPEINPTAYRNHQGGIWSSSSSIQRIEHSINSRLLIRENLSGNKEYDYRAQCATDQFIVQNLIKYTRSFNLLMLTRIFWLVFKKQRISSVRVISLYFKKMFLAVKIFLKNTT